MAASGITCQVYGVEAPTRFVEFHQNVGMLFARRRTSIRGMLCKKCVSEKFWKMTGTTLVLGPWGTISLITAPVFIVNNILRYVRTLGMPAVPSGAKPPVLDQAAVQRLSPYGKAMAQRLNAKEPVADVANDIARQAGVTPGQVVKYVIAMSRGKTQPVTGGAPLRKAADLPPAELAPETQIEGEIAPADV